MAMFLHIFPGIELYFAAAISILLFLRWKKTKDKTSYYWMLAFVFYSLYDIIQIVFISQIFVFEVFSYYSVHFLRQTFISLMFVSVYYGIVRLLTRKKLITQVLPFTFFFLQEILIAYGDFAVKNIEIADKLHVIFFDVPFNLIIAMLFFKLYQVNKKNYSLMISLAWMGYAILVPIFFYKTGGLILYSISLLPMLLMFFAFLVFFKAPTGEELIEIKPAVEKRLKSKKRYRLKPGYSYLVEEPKSEIAFGIFVDAVMHGIRGLCITRTKPEWIRERYELKKTPVLWLTQTNSGSSETVDPSELEQLVDLIDKFVTTAKFEVVKEEEEDELFVDKYSITAEPTEKDNNTIFKNQSKEEKKYLTTTEEKKIPEKDKEEQTQHKENIADKQGRHKPGTHKGSFVIIGDKEDNGGEDKEKIDDAIKMKNGRGYETTSPYNMGDVKEDKKEEPLIEKSLQGHIKDKYDKNELQGEKDLQVVNDEEKSRKHLFHRVKDKVKFLIQSKKEISKKEIDELLKEKGKSGESEHKTYPQKENQSQKVQPKKINNSGLYEKKERSEEREPQKPLYINKKRTGKMTIIGGSEDVKKSVRHQAYLVLKTPQINHRKSIVLIEGIEYLITNNSFRAVKNIISLLKDKISEGDSALIVPIDPETLSKVQINQIRQNFYIFDPNRNNYF